jgi:hypothetical protein
MYLIAAGTSVGIAIALYPLLKWAGPALALRSVVFRTIDAVFYTVAVVSLLAIQSLSQVLAPGPADSRAPSQLISPAKTVAMIDNVFVSPSGDRRVIFSGSRHLARCCGSAVGCRGSLP